MKTKITNLVFIALMMIGMSFAKTTKGQTVYQVIPWDNYSNFADVPYCPCDSIKCAPQPGVTVNYWGYPGNTYYGDTLVLASGFNGQVTCNSSAGVKSLRLRPTFSPTSGNFTTTATICGIEMMTLADLNADPYGFNARTWNNGATTSSITVGEGVHSLMVSNVCGVAYDTITITESNPNDPHLGQNITTCQGSPIVLDPGTGYSDYLWLPGNSTDSTLSPTTSGSYVVEVTNTVGGCIDRDTIVITFKTPSSQEIGLVTIDTTSNGNNRITWNGSLHGDGAYVKVYREITANNYVVISTALYNLGTWTDTVNSRSQPWRYKIALVDTCGNTGPQSAYVQSIHTWVSTDGLGWYTVQWTHYLVESKSNVVSQYNIYSGQNLGMLYYLTFVSGSVNVYSIQNFVDSFIVIGAEMTAKTVYEDALSNWIVATDVVGIKEEPKPVDFLIYPNPTTDRVMIQTNEINIVIDIMSISGDYVIASRDKSIDVSSLSSGTYILRMTTTKGYQYQKFVKR